MPGTARPDHEPTCVVAFRIPVSLRDELRIVMLDPRTGSVRRGRHGRLIERILRDWLDTQKVARP